MKPFSFETWWRAHGRKLAANSNEVTARMLAAHAWEASRQNYVVSANAKRDPVNGSVPPELSAKWRKLVKPIFFEMYREYLCEVCIVRKGTEVTLKRRRNASLPLACSAEDRA
jgi:hypothetical protein